VTTDLPDLGWDAGWADAFEPMAADGLRAGRVAGVDRGAVTLLSGTGEVRATLGGGVLGELAVDPASGPCVGDWGAFRSWPDGRSTLEAVLPRRTAFVRNSAAQDSFGQVLAANIDAVLVTVSLALEPSLGRVERLVALAWESGAQPVLVLTKSDLVGDAAEVCADVQAVAPGVPTVVVSARTRAGLDELGVVLSGDSGRPGRTSALLGQSGAGKSTLINALTGRTGPDALAVAELGVHGKGRHTTVRRELVCLPGGGMVIDTPGLRGVGLVDVDEGLERVFPEIDSLSEHCRFADCAHEAEPDCAVLLAVETGALSERRLLSYRKLQREAAWMARRTDARARAEAKRRWALIHKQVRRSGSIRP
jgi:ribosome biogenesis GTPase / thiamine phosphate phosphatase